MTVPEQPNTTDPKTLAEKGYKDPSLIEKRKALYLHTSPHYLVEDEVIKILQLNGNQRILDVGCGSGQLTERIAVNATEVIGIDISSGMFEAIKRRNKENPRVHFSVADVQSLPFIDDTFDRICAVHMFYHVPNIRKGITEIKRVLRPDGFAIITANSIKSKPFLRQLKQQMRESFLPNYDYPDLTMRFNSEEGQILLQQHFSRVKRRDYISTIRLVSSTPYVNYFDSLREFWTPTPNRENWASVLEFVDQTISKIIHEKGEFIEENIFSIFTCQ